jgi:hypothetical protein
MGSRDVDLGFHIDTKMTRDELADSNFAKALSILLDLGYWEYGTSRYCKIIHRDSSSVLTEMEAARFPRYELFYLYVDPIVDNMHPENASVFRIKPIDEPLLSDAYEKMKLHEILINENEKILIPDPDVLLAMKLSSFPSRTKDDKKVKDACDIYSLLWHSEMDLKEITTKVRTAHPELCSNLQDEFKPELIAKVSFHLGIDEETCLDVIKSLF